MNKKTLLFITALSALIPNYQWCMEAHNNNRQNIKAECYTCDKSENVQIITLSCNHQFCNGCLQEQITEALDGKFLPFCRHQQHRGNGPKFTPNDIQKITNDPHRIAIFKELIQKKAQNKAQPLPKGAEGKEEVAEAQCLICQSAHDNKEFVKLPRCGHSFGYNCLKQSITAAIAQSKAPFCPHELCMKKKENNTIALEDIRQISRDNTFIDLVDTFLFKKEARDNANNLPNLKHCPGAGCNWMYFVEPQDRGEITCENENCKQKYCMQCQINHPNNQRCQEAIALKNRNPKEEEAANEAFIKNNCIDCPNPNPVKDRWGRILYQKCPNKIVGKLNCNKVKCEITGSPAYKGCGYIFCWNCLEEVDANYNHVRTGVSLMWEVHKEKPNACVCRNPILLNKNNPQVGIERIPAPPIPQQNIRINHAPFDGVFPRINQAPFGGVFPNANLDNDEIANFIEQVMNDERDGLQGRQNPNRRAHNYINRPRPIRFNPAYLLLAVPPVLAVVTAIRIRQWVKSPVAMKMAISTLNALIETAKSKDANNLSGHLINNEYKLTISNDKITQLREYALRDQYKEFIALASHCKKELEDMTASNAGFINGFKKVRWGLSADIVNAKQWMLSKMRQA